MLSAIDVPTVRETLGLPTRLRDIPNASHVRGVWFSMVSDHVRRLGRTETLAWQTMIGRRTRRMPFLSYPLRDYLEELAMAAALTNPREPAEGMRAIWHNATSMYLATPFGRSLVNLVRPNPMRYLKWLVDNRDHFCNYGSWKLIKQNEHYVIMEMHDEFIWLESAHRGGAEGLLDALGVEGTVEPELTDGPYSGRMHVRWFPRAS